ncbi:PTS transporter subunit EIIC [Spiroplasma endosymbiont of Labia minor]|uniref:PTS transporter subunit EIIC n=1 Tax=Spiroplasma endosymbiont of Labia minor TaxID=3066305 RepID=UPI0030CE1245
MSKNLRELKQDKFIDQILIQIGGIMNIKDVYHCATRMRLTLNNNNLININDLKKIIGIQGALWSNGELQIIVGAQVSTITELLKERMSESHNNSEIINANTDELISFAINADKNQIDKKIPLWKRFFKTISAIFGPMIPFLIGVGLIMALQQILIQIGLIVDATDTVKNSNPDIFSQVVSVISSTGFKFMGVIAMWSTVRYLGGKQQIALALGLIMIAPSIILQIPADGIKMFNIGSIEIRFKPFYSTILVFIVIGIILVHAQKLMDKHFNSVANFLLNPFLSLFLGGLLAFFILGPIMGILENWILSAFNWFMKIPFGIGTLIVGLSWQPLVVFGIHNILFLAATMDLSVNNNPSLFLAAAFAAAWGQLGASIGVALRSKKIVDRSAATAAALPGIISGPTESVIYGITLPRMVPFITGIIAGAIGGWMVGLMDLRLDTLAALGGAIGFIAYHGDHLWKALVIDLATFALGIIITYFFYKETKTEQELAKKSLKSLNNQEFLKLDIDFEAQGLLKLINKSKIKFWDKNIKKEIKNYILKHKDSLITLNEKLKDKFDSEKFELNIIASQLKEIKTPRQEQIKLIYIELQKQINELKSISSKTNLFLKNKVRLENIQFKLDKIDEKRNDKQMMLVQKAQKLINSGNDRNIAKGNELILKSKLVSQKTLNKIHELNEKLKKYSAEVDLENSKLTQILEVFYQQIAKSIDEIASIKNEDLSGVKKMFEDDIFHTVIREKQQINI